MVLACAVVLKFIYNPVNFDNIKARMQAWIDSDTVPNNEVTLENKENADEISEAEVEEEMPVEEEKPVEEKYIDIVQSSGKTAQAVYIEEDGQEFLQK